jgi:hypothetical protein
MLQEQRRLDYYVEQYEHSDVGESFIVVGDIENVKKN